MSCIKNLKNYDKTKPTKLYGEDFATFYEDCVALNSCVIVPHVTRNVTNVPYDVNHVSVVRLDQMNILNDSHFPEALCSAIACVCE